MAQDTTGLYGSGFYSTDLRGRRLQIDFDADLPMLAPNEAPMLAISSKSKQPTNDSEPEWMEDEYFITRSIKATYVVLQADNAAANDYVAYLQFESKNDMMALEAPPYLADLDDYDAVSPTNTQTLILQVVETGGTTDQDTMYIIAEKKGVEQAGMWRTVDVSARYTSEVTTDPTGYFLLIGHAEDVGTFHMSDAGACNDISDHSGAIALDECVVLSSDKDIWTGGVPGEDFDSPDATAQSNSVVVNILTPNIANKGFREGSGLPEESRKGIRTYSNYVQIFKTVGSITGTAEARGYIGTPEHQRVLKRKGKEHAHDQEWAIITNGAKAGTLTEESPRRTMGGLGVGLTDKSGFIKTHHPGTATANATSGDGVYCIPDDHDEFFYALDAVAERLFDGRVGSDKRILFCSNKLIGRFSRYAQGLKSTAYSTVWNLDPTAGNRFAEYGLRVKTIITSYGDIELIRHPSLTGALENYGFFLDDSLFKVMPYRGTKLNLNEQLPGYDKIVDYYLTETTVKLKHEQEHGIIKLVASAL